MYGHKRVRERRNDTLTRVGWEQLEVLLATWYRGQGYEVEHTGTAASGTKYDGGIDLRLRRPGEYVLVQVKHWNAYKVPHNDVHQLLGLMVNEGATGAILITSGEFTKAAIEAATRHGHVRLIAGDELRAMLGPLPEADSLLPAGARSRASEQDASVVFIKAVFVLLMMFFVVWQLNRVVGFVAATLQHSAQASVSRPPAPAAVATPPQTPPAVPVAHSEVAGNPCHEVIDQPSGTYFDNCAPVVRPRVPTAAEVREAQRKADEAMKVLAPNTPEM